MSARLEDLQRSFARHLRAEGRSERTVTIYGQAIRFYGDWLAAQGRPAIRGRAWASIDAEERVAGLAGDADAVAAVTGVAAAELRVGHAHRGERS